MTGSNNFYVAGNGSIRQKTENSRPFTSAPAGIINNTFPSSTGQSTSSTISRSSHQPPYQSIGAQTYTSHLQAQGPSNHVHVTPHSINLPPLSGPEQITNRSNSALRSDFSLHTQKAPPVTSSQGQVNFQDFDFAPATTLNVVQGTDTNSQAMTTNFGSQ